MLLEQYNEFKTSEFGKFLAKFLKNRYDNGVEVAMDAEMDSILAFSAREKLLGANSELKQIRNLMFNEDYIGYLLEE